MKTWLAIALSAVAVGFGLASVAGPGGIDPLRRTLHRVIEISSIGSARDDVVAIPSIVALDRWPAIRAEAEKNLAAAAEGGGFRSVAELVPIPDREAATFFDSFAPGADGVTRLVVDGRILPIRRRFAGIAVAPPAVVGDGSAEPPAASVLVEFGVSRRWIPAAAVPDLSAALGRGSALAEALAAAESSLDSPPEPVATVDPSDGAVLIGEGQETGRFRYGAGVYSARLAVRSVAERVHSPGTRRVLGGIGWGAILIGATVLAMLWRSRSTSGVVLLGRAGRAILLSAAACAVAALAWAPLIEAGIARASDPAWSSDRLVQPVALGLTLAVVVPALALAAAVASGPGLRADGREVVVQSVARARGIAWDDVRAIEVRGVGRSRHLVLRGSAGTGVYIPRPPSPRSRAAAVHALMSVVPEPRRPMLRRGVRDWMRSVTPRA